MRQPVRESLSMWTIPVMWANPASLTGGPWSSSLRSVVIHRARSAQPSGGWSRVRSRHGRFPGRVLLFCSASRDLPFQCVAVGRFLLAADAINLQDSSLLPQTVPDPRPFLHKTDEEARRGHHSGSITTAHAQRPGGSVEIRLLGSDRLHRASSVVLCGGFCLTSSHRSTPSSGSSTS